MFQILRVLAGAYLGLVLLIFFGQRKFIYHPGRGSRAEMEKSANDEGFQAWEDKSGRFIGWKKLNPSKNEHGRILIVHGNAGSAIDRLGYANELEKIEPLDVYILEYPGYGARPGSPSQQSLFDAAAEAVELLKKDGPIYLIGESLGTGVACYLAGTNSEAIRGMLLIAPYDSLTGVAQYHMPLFPVKLLLLDRFPSARYLKDYHGPVAVLVSRQDVIVPMRFGRQLFAAYEGPKRIWELPDAGHNDLLDHSESWWRELVAFWEQNPSVRGAASGDKSDTNRQRSPL